MSEKWNSKRRGWRGYFCGGRSSRPGLKENKLNLSKKDYNAEKRVRGGAGLWWVEGAGAEGVSITLLFFNF